MYLSDPIIYLCRFIYRGMLGSMLWNGRPYVSRVLENLFISGLVSGSGKEPV